ncbi:MAG: LacI family transcriptional regulator [Chloroflexi bacterium]|nr:MAG: LacI family transcriptional regulator [Chloroflexota bacterium]
MSTNGGTPSSSTLNTTTLQGRLVMHMKKRRHTDKIRCSMEEAKQMKDVEASAGRPATIKDVAAHAGVSVATVSAVINRNKYVSPNLAQRVQESITALGYERNSLAQSLKKQTSQTIGLIVSDITNPFFTSVVRGVENVANARGYSLILGNSDEDLKKEMGYMHLLESKRADGLIVAFTLGNHEYLHSWPAHRLPLVGIDRLPDNVSIDAVLIDNVAGARHAVEHLITLGHERIGIVTGLPGITTTEERLIGYQRALAAHGIPLDPALIVEGNSRIDGGERAALQLLAREAARPTALFVTSGLMIISALQAINQMGLRCPEDIALVGFDDFEWAAVMYPRLTTVSQPTYEIGQKAAQLLFERLEKRDAAPQVVRLQPQLIIRESSGAPLQSATPSKELPGYVHR